MMIKQIIIYQKNLYGRTNTIKFKLCYEYCATCKKIGIKINDQKCETCLEQYNFTYYNDSYNCVEEGYFIDKENNKKVKCNETNSKYYIELETGKIICFKIDYDCPPNYPNFNSMTNECTKINHFTTYTTSIISTAKDSSVLPKTNPNIYSMFINDIIKTYSTDNEDIIIEGVDNFIFQLTSTQKENNRLNLNLKSEYSLSIIDFGECEELIKGEKDLNPNNSLILLKYEKEINISNRRIVQYEIFNPLTKEKISLDICKNIKIDINIPVLIDEKNLFKYDQSSDFYNDICFPYTNEYKSDVILKDRRNEYINNNMSLCEDNCEYKGYDTTKKNIKCNCDVKIKFEFIIDIEINTDKLLAKFKDLKQTTNIFVVKCYKLLFSEEGIKYNIGSYLILAMILFNIILVFLFKFKGYKELCDIINKLVNDSKENIETNQNNKNENKKERKRKGNRKKVNINVNKKENKKENKKVNKNENKKEKKIHPKKKVKR